MAKSTSILSCHLCKPELWKSGKRSKGTYTCKNCRNIINVVLRKKKGEPNVS